MRVYSFVAFTAFTISLLGASYLKGRSDGIGVAEERAQQEVTISQGVDRLLAVAENYPELKSSSHFLNLQRNLTEIESQISASRRAYNAAVQSWNNGVESFPGNLFAGFWGFEPAEWFEVQSQERSAVELNL